MKDDMFLGIEIGGTKLQLGVGHGDGSPLVELVRCDVDARRGAAGILEQIEREATQLARRFPLGAVGFGFGGPVEAVAGRVTKSHQIAGWDHWPLVSWCEQTIGLPAALGNDCDCAALAEACYGAGRGSRIVFYVTIGTGIGGGLVIDGRLHGADRPAVAEIGHLRPGLSAERSDATVESLASGPGIAAAAVRRGLANLPEQFTAKQIAAAARAGQADARQVLDEAMQALGWAVAQMITLLAPQVIVLGGGVSLMGEDLFYEPVRRHVARYVFPPLLDSYQIVAPRWGEEVVVHGALALAALQFNSASADSL
ncbi:MAG: ROK family protein [Planctomycetota bacterium]